MDAKVKELQSQLVIEEKSEEIDKLKTQLEVKSAEIDKLKKEHKSLINLYVQLKRKQKDNLPMASQNTMPNSVEHDPEVCDTIIL